MQKFIDNTFKGSKEEFYALMEEALQAEEKRFIVTANPETFVTGLENEAYGEILGSKYVTIVPDGIGIVKALEAAGFEGKGRITGVDLTKHLFVLADKLGLGLYLLGSRQEVLDALKSKLENEYPSALVVGCHNGYDFKEEEVFKEIDEEKPDIILVALGIPGQELLINKYYDRFEKGVFMGVGGSFDVLSGIKKRAPGIFIKLNLEWLYRISKEPKRIKRFVKHNLKFISKIRKL